MKFSFHNPTHIEFGSNSISKLKKLVPKNAKKILFVYGGGSIKKNGVYEQVLKACNNYTVVEFFGIQPNPTYEKALQAMEIVRNENIDFILAVGGGSVIDSVKFISAGAYYPNDPWEICLKDFVNLQKTVPFGVVLTLPATGSEFNMYSVISRGPQKLGFGHPLVFPKFSILDPQVTLTLDKRQVGNGIVDAYMHTLEVYLTYPVGAVLQDYMAEAVLKTLLQEGPKTFNNLQDLESRSHFMWAASMALSSIFSGGVPQDWSTHQIGHELTALYNIDHARTLALAWPVNMKARKENKKDKMKQYAERVLGLQGSADEVFELAIKKTCDFFNSVGVPTQITNYSEIPMTINNILHDKMKSEGFTVAGEKGDLTLEKIKQLF